ncbi:MAG: SDR family oxidoreductase [Terriglobales bacterium]
MVESERPVAVVSGASSGIGQAAARRLLHEGWDIAALGRRRERLEALAAEAPAGRVLPVIVDLLQNGEIAAAAAPIRAWRSRLQALITSAGDFYVRGIAQTTAEEFERMWRLTVGAKFLLVRELLPLLEAAAGVPPRAVIHVASLAAHHPFAGESAYQSAMHGVMGLAMSQDAELRGRGIRVAVVSPGLVRTELTERAFGPAALKEALNPESIAVSIGHLIQTIRAGGYIPEIFQVPGNWP